MKTLSYLRVSTEDQNLGKFKSGILEYAQRMGFPKPRFTEEKISGRINWRRRKLGRLIENLKPDQRRDRRLFAVFEK